MADPRLTRRAVIGGAAAVVVGGLAAARYLASESNAAVCAGFQPGGWGPDWVATHWMRLGTCRGGNALVVPKGLQGTAVDQPIPVFMQDRDFATGEIELAFKTSNPTLRPGILFGATSPFAFRGVTVERGRLVLAEYEREERRVVASISVEPLQVGRETRLLVVVADGRVQARLGSAELSANLSTRHGAPGVLAVHPLDLRRADLAVSRFDVLPDGSFSPTRPVCVISTTGTPVPRFNGGWTTRVQAWSAWPADVVFEVSDSEDMAGATALPAIQLTQPPYVARADLSYGERPVYWRAGLRSRTSSSNVVSGVHAVAPPARDRPLVLLAASCAQFTGPPENRGLDRLVRAAPERPALLVYQGDIGYPNNYVHAAYSAKEDFFSDRFQRLLARPDLVELRRQVPLGTTIDDHDYGPPNNANRNTVREWAIDLWNRIHPDPSDDGYFDTRFGDVHCLTLDVRRYADPASTPNSPTKSRLGARQFTWLERRMKESDARLFVVFSAGTFARRANDQQAKVRDTFIYGWPAEYERAMGLFMSIQSQGRRVVIVSGDAHSMRIHRHPDPLSGLETSVPVWEFICSGLRAELWSGAPDGDPTVDPNRNVLGHSGSGMIVVDPPGSDERSITLRAIAARANDPLDLFPPLELPFEPTEG